MTYIPHASVAAPGNVWRGVPAEAVQHTTSRLHSQDADVEVTRNGGSLPSLREGMKRCRKQKSHSWIYPVQYIPTRIGAGRLQCCASRAMVRVVERVPSPYADKAYARTAPCHWQCSAIEILGVEAGRLIELSSTTGSILASVETSPLRFPKKPRTM
jgi:hypothetical protein